MARRKPPVKDPRETPQANVEEATSAVTAPEPTPPAYTPQDPSLPPRPEVVKGDNSVKLWGFTRIDH